MHQRIDLTSGNILSKLSQLALPIMGTSFIQTTYNLVDMMCIGKTGSHAVAAVGTAGFFTWLGSSIVVLSRLGTEVKVSQSMGQSNIDKVKSFMISGIHLNLFCCIIYMLILLIFKDSLVGFFKLQDPQIITDTKIYLTLVTYGMIFYFLNPLFTSLFTATGTSKIPFYFNTTGLVINIILDILLIFGFVPFPALGVLGAALATVIAQIIVFCLFVITIVKSPQSYFKWSIIVPPKFKYIFEIVIVGFPVSLQECLFSFFSMVIGRFVARFGATAIAVQKIGSQIESISWLTAGGFSTALSTFVRQNYGAKQYQRIHKGFKTTITLTISLGIMTTMILIFGGKAIFSFFIYESEVITEGGNYLRILGYSQLFMCIEIAASGAFNGLGKTYIPASISILFTGARIPIAYLLTQSLGLDGIWWTISLSTFVKGILSLSIYTLLYKLNMLWKNA